MEFEQIAFVADKDFAIQVPFEEEGVEWSRDIVHSKGVLRSGVDQRLFVVVENAAELRFNYSIFPGKEFELLHYFRGRSFLGHRLPGSISHCGVHVDKIDDFRDYLQNKGFSLIQEVVTVKHSNVPEDRHYHYAIYKHPSMMFFWKLIERLPGDTAWITAQIDMEARYSHDIF